MIVTRITHEPIHKPVWDVHTNGNVFPGLIVWDLHKNENVFLGLTVYDIHTNGNVFLGFTMWDVHTYGNDFLGLPYWIYIPTEMIGFRCLTRSDMAQPVSLEGLSPTIFGSCGKDPPYRPHSLGDGSKYHHGKGLKTVCIGPMRTSGYMGRRRS